MKFLQVFLSCLVLVAFPIHAEPIKILVFGDSFAAGYGLPASDGFCEVLESYLKNEGWDAEVINSGASGETTQGALARADQTYAMAHDLVVLEIGANDMLRGYPPSQTRQNIQMLIEKSEKPVYLLGIRAIPSYGPLYAQAFDQIYPDLAQANETGFYPFLFAKIFDEGPAQSWRYLQRDLLHANAEGVKRIVDDLGPDFVKWAEAEMGAARLEAEPISD